MRLHVSGFAIALLFAAVLAPRVSHAAEVIEAGAGWEDMGALEGTLEWGPRIQGSRKDVPAFVGWRHVGDTRVYWAPFARLNYANFWSIGGAGNLLGATVAPAGLGVFLTPPGEVQVGKWSAVAEVNFGSFKFAGNVTPNGPADSRIPDPNAYRAGLRAEVAQTGGVDANSVITQHYPLGPYQCVTLATPIQIRAWTMITPKTGVGFFVEGYPLILEWNVSKGGNSTPAYGYSVMGGISVTFL